MPQLDPSRPSRSKNSLPSPGESERFDKGIAMRRLVLGSEYVDRSLNSADEFMGPLQRLITEWCWGDVWGDDQLPPRTRSLLNIALLTALNRKEELRVHVRGAVNNGVSVEEIRGALIHATIYAGVPAGLDSTKAAREVLLDMGVLT